MLTCNSSPNSALTLNPFPSTYKYISRCKLINIFPDRNVLTPTAVAKVSDELASGGLLGPLLPDKSRTDEASS
jgi:hypothetical protein